MAQPSPQTAAGGAARDGRRGKLRALGKGLLCALVLALFLLFALMLGDAEQQATALGWLPFLALLVGLLLAWIYVLVAARGLSFTDLGPVGAVRRGSVAAFPLRFSNGTPLQLFRVEAFFGVFDAEGRRVGGSSATLSLGPFESYDMDFRVAFDHLGCYEAGLERVVVHDFANLFSRSIANDLRSSACVTPSLVGIEDIHFSEDVTVESIDAAKATLGDSMDYAYVRPYVAGDPLKTIHWKLSARSEHLQTRLYEVYDDPGVTVVLDFRAPAADPRELMELRDGVVESGLSVACHALERGMEVDIRWCDKLGERRVLHSWDDEVAADFVASLPAMSSDEAAAERTSELIGSLMYGQEGQGNVVLCSADVSSGMVGTVMELAEAERAPLFVAVMPVQLEGDALEERRTLLSRLSDADIPTVCVSQAVELAGARL